MSNEHIIYLKKIKRKKFLIKLTQIMIITIFLLIWQILSDFKIINSFIFSSPKNIINTIIKLYNSNNLFNHIGITLYELIISFVLGTFIGIFIAGILWSNNFLAKVLDPYLTILNSLPKVALGPILIIWVGAKIKSIIVMALLISVIVTIMNVYQGFITTDNDTIKLFKSLKATKLQIFFKLVLPSNYSNIISSLKVNLSMSLVGIIMGEFLVSKQGIGYLIVYGSQVFNLSLVMSGIFILCILVTIMYYVIVLIEKRINKITK